jgi:hypothetical protein
MRRYLDTTAFTQKRRKNHELEKRAKLKSPIFQKLHKNENENCSSLIDEHSAPRTASSRDDASACVYASVFCSFVCLFVCFI